MRKLLASGLAALLLFSAGTGASALQIAPYEGYTYNTWGESVPAPAGYLPERVVYAEDIGVDSLNGPEDLFVYKDRLYIADTGNNRILVLNDQYRVVQSIQTLTGPDGKPTALKKPSGLYIRDDTLYIADTGNARVVSCDLNGRVQHEFLCPNDKVIQKDFLFTPTKVVSDSTGYVYVLSQNSYQGLLTYDHTGAFIGFFGSNKVAVTLAVVVSSMWKKLLSKTQRDSMARTVPIEISNVFVDNEDFIYTVTKGSDSTEDHPKGKIQKLNALGENILLYNKKDADASGGSVLPTNIYGDAENAWYKSKKIDSVIVDVHVDDGGVISALDQQRGRVFQYDQESNLLFVFGGIGNQKGTFAKPVAVEEFDGKYIVLDASKNSVTVFAPTYYAGLILKADALYTKGLYTEGESLWEEALKINSSCTLAYRGIGKSLLQKERYQEAMKYLKTGEDRTSYSIAFREYRREVTRKYFVPILLGTAAGISLLVFLLIRLARWLGVPRKKRSIRYR